MNKIGRFLALSFALLFFRFIFSVTVNHLLPVHVINEDKIIVNESAYLSKRKPTYKISEVWGKGESTKLVSIVINGYQKEQDFMMLPLYPLLMRYFYKLIPFLDIDGIYVMGTILSSFFFGLALFYLDRIFDILWFNDEKRFMVYLLIVFFPANYFYNLVYPESFFLLLLVLFLLNLFKKRYFWSSIFLGMSIVTRFYGFVLIIPFILYIFLAERHSKKFKMTSKLITLLLIALMPLLIFCYYLFTNTGTLTLIGTEQTNYMYLPLAYFFDLFAKTNGQFILTHVFSASLLIFSLGLMVYSFIKFYLIYEGRSLEQNALFVFGLVYMLVVSSFSIGAPILRYLSVCLPLFLLPAMFYEKSIKNGYLFGILFVLLSLQVMYFSLFLTGITAYGY